MNGALLRTLRTSLVLAAVALTAGCATKRSSPFERSGSDRPAGPTVLVVDNLASQDMTIYVHPEGGIRERIGLASGLRKTRFTMPARIITTTRSITIEADPIGSSQSAFSNEIVVQPGDTVGIQIPPR
jgi:hypothetical protein